MASRSVVPPAVHYWFRTAAVFRATEASQYRQSKSNGAVVHKVIVAGAAQMVQVLENQLDADL